MPAGQPSIGSMRPMGYRQFAYSHLFRIRDAAIRSLLVNVTATDPVTLIAVALLLAGVAALASWIPARRAMAVSPTEALRGGR